MSMFDKKDILGLVDFENNLLLCMIVSGRLASLAPPKLHFLTNGEKGIKILI